MSKVVFFLEADGKGEARLQMEGNTMELVTALSAAMAANPDVEHILRHAVGLFEFMVKEEGEDVKKLVTKKELTKEEFYKA